LVKVTRAECRRGSADNPINDTGTTAPKVIME
jgi:hypothetical protein